MIDDKEFSTDIARVLNLDLKSTDKPSANGSKKEPTLTEHIDSAIAALQLRIKWLEAVRSTL